MKNLNKWSAALMIIIMASCTGDFEDINTNQKNPTVVDPAYILTGVEGSLVNQYVFSSDLFANETGSLAQYFVKHLYTNENVYNFRGAMFNAYWNTYYNQMIRMREAVKMIETPPYNLTDEAVKANQKAVFEILEIWTWTQITDQFGDIPYSEALQGNEAFQPAYDTQEDIYADLLERIDAAVQSIDETASSFGAADVILGGDMSGWVRFANSLKLRMGMRIIDANNSLGTTAVSEAIADGVINSNAENITYQFLDETFRSPLRRNDGEAAWDDVVICKTYTDIVNDLNDPRRGYQMYGWGPAEEPFRGYPITDDNYVRLGSGRYDWAFLGYAFRYWDEYEDEQWSYILMDYAEISFLMAEAVERNIVTGSAETYYNQAITASMEYWGVDAAATANYLAQTEVAYATAGSTWQEKIGTQKYIAHFPYGSEGFAEARRLDYPQLVAPIKGGAQLPDSEIPSRLKYPDDEVLLNSANTAAAIDRIGGENSLTVQVWWDVN